MFNIGSVFEYGCFYESVLGVSNRCAHIEVLVTLLLVNVFVFSS